MLKHLKHHWKRTVSALMALVMAVGMLPVSGLAAEVPEPAAKTQEEAAYAPTGNFELNIAGTTAWAGGEDDLPAMRAFFRQFGGDRRPLRRLLRCGGFVAALQRVFGFSDKKLFQVFELQGPFSFREPHGCHPPPARSAARLRRPLRYQEAVGLRVFMFLAERPFLRVGSPFISVFLSAVAGLPLECFFFCHTKSSVRVPATCINDNLSKIYPKSWYNSCRL